MDTFLPPGKHITFIEGKIMNKGLLNLVASVMLLLASSVSHALTISFVPYAQSVILGSSVDVGIKISDLGNLTAPSLSTFDLNVGFNPSVLAFANAVYGDQGLGDQLDLLGLGFPIMSTSPSTGSVNVFELSFNTPTELIDNQVDSFILATLTFNTLSRGTSGLGISINALGDENGDPLTANVQNGNVTVPEPSVLLLLGIGYLAFFGMKNRAGLSKALQSSDGAVPHRKVSVMTIYRASFRNSKVRNGLNNPPRSGCTSLLNPRLPSAIASNSAINSRALYSSDFLEVCKHCYQPV